jgi:hypothetical protein
MRKQKNDRRGHLEGTYLFKDKDPVIDIIRTGIQDWATRRGIKMAKAIREVCEIAGVSVACVNGWLYKDIGKPYWWSACAVGLACGHKYFQQFLPARERRKLQLVVNNTRRTA